MKELSSQNDSEIIGRFQHGDLDAIELLVIKYKDKVYTFILSVVKDKYQAEDIFQDVFFKLIELMRNGRYTDKGKFIYWANHIAYNKCIDHFRKIKRMKRLTNNYGYNILTKAYLHGDGADIKIKKQERNDMVNHLVDLLPEDQREVIIMRHYGEFSFKEIARLQQCSINTALGRMRYGLINMRKMMAEKVVD